MEAKLIRVIPSDVAWYFTQYEYECIKCGAHYTRKQHNNRINPYCCTCNAEITKERQKINAKRCEQRKINKVLEDIKAEIEQAYFHKQISTRSRKIFMDAIDKHIGGKE